MGERESEFARSSPQDRKHARESLARHGVQNRIATLKELINYRRMKRFFQIFGNIWKIQETMCVTN